VLLDERRNLTLQPLAASTVTSLTDAELLHGADARHTVAVFDLITEGDVQSRQVVYFAKALDLQLGHPRIEAKLTEQDRGRYRLRLSASSELARGLWISFGDIDAQISDNSLTLLPGEPIELTVTSHASLQDLRRHLQLRSLDGSTKART